ncbi:integrase [Pararhizobium capsulatum DSM 1112]|uniref:Integrase n=1 Tax=Pararhizobium capsulatum DSM 1112 TaxID=1121113 RepID=A0ABU0C3F2_9HYPH|nr:integrase [Pararhizobium capsulatum DSM 1112]
MPGSHHRDFVNRTCKNGLMCFSAHDLRHTPSGALSTHLTVSGLRLRSGYPVLLDRLLQLRNIPSSGHTARAARSDAEMSPSTV